MKPIPSAVPDRWSPQAMPAIAVRPLAPGDLGAIRRLMARLSDADRYLRFFHAVKQVPEAELRALGEPAPPAFGLVAEADGDVVGAAHAFDEGARVYELALVVDPAARRHGIAGLLVDGVIEELRRRHADALVAHALAINADFAHVARAHGMEPAATIAGVTQWLLQVKGA